MEKKIVLPSARSHGIKKIASSNVLINHIAGFLGPEMILSLRAVFKNYRPGTWGFFLEEKLWFPPECNGISTSINNIGVMYPLSGPSVYHEDKDTERIVIGGKTLIKYCTYGSSFISSFGRESRMVYSPNLLKAIEEEREPKIAYTVSKPVPVDVLPRRVDDPFTLIRSHREARNDIWRRVNALGVKYSYWYWRFTRNPKLLRPSILSKRSIPYINSIDLSPVGSERGDENVLTIGEILWSGGERELLKKYIPLENQFKKEGKDMKTALATEFFERYEEAERCFKAWYLLWCGSSTLGEIRMNISNVQEALDDNRWEELDEFMGRGDVTSFKELRTYCRNLNFTVECFEVLEKYMEFEPWLVEWKDLNDHNVYYSSEDGELIADMIRAIDQSLASRRAKSECSPFFPPPSFLTSTFGFSSVQMTQSHMHSLPSLPIPMLPSIPPRVFDLPSLQKQVSALPLTTMHHPPAFPHSAIPSIFSTMGMPTPLSSAFPPLHTLRIPGSHMRSNAIEGDQPRRSASIPTHAGQIFVVSSTTGIKTDRKASTSSRKYFHREYGPTSRDRIIDYLLRVKGVHGLFPSVYSDAFSLWPEGSPSRSSYIITSEERRLENLLGTLPEGNEWRYPQTCLTVTIHIVDSLLRMRHHHVIAEENRTFSTQIERSRYVHLLSRVVGIIKRKGRLFENIESHIKSESLTNIHSGVVPFIIASSKSSEFLSVSELVSLVSVGERILVSTERTLEAEK